MHITSVYDCQKESVLTLFLITPPLRFLPFYFGLKGSTCLTARVAVFAFTAKPFAHGGQRFWYTTKNLNHLFFYYSKDKTFGIQQKRVRFFPILPGRKLRDVFHKFKVEVSRQRMAPLVKWPITICADFRTS